MHRLILILILLALVALPAPAYAAEPCGSYTSMYDPGKTEEGFSARASDGCHVVNWTSNTVDQSGSGTLTFRTMNPATQPWESGYSLPKMQDGYCAFRAAHEANLFMTNKFGVAPGVEVSVSYRCY